ncbi:sensor histidine kinase [Aurantimonas sp. A3-2-R12]|uniref:sensor histidine kinase n=1 Tax=Aurantimonas sp. A3-2-R12 TaxID=3114362 RepID=UPI002E18E0E5|nr:GAF domain-containing protein [Aurantimonas sp. A3-2-R12]
MNTGMEASRELAAEDEEQRLQVLRRYDILDTPPDGAFDRVTSLAARLFNVPIAIVSLVDRDRIWFKSKCGVEVQEIGREPGLCASAILQDGPWLLTDASVDPRAMANPLVAGELGLRFYLGAPLRTWDGHNLGTLCVIDQKPREVSPAAIEHLNDLATLVMDQMELRLTARTAVAQREMLLHELHHRVKNNLQILLSVVSSSERRARSAETVEFVQSLRGRLVAISSAHDAMRAADSLGKGRTGELLEQISHTIQAALGGDGELVTEIEDHEITNEVLLPLALMLNELLTNAYKHGLHDGGGRIHVRFHGTGTTYEMTVRDNGPGIGDSSASANSSGLVFVKGLARQIGGEFDARNENGAVFSVTFRA